MQQLMRLEIGSCQLSRSITWPCFLTPFGRNFILNINTKFCSSMSCLLALMTGQISLSHLNISDADILNVLIFHDIKGSRGSLTYSPFAGNLYLLLRENF